MTTPVLKPYDIYRAKLVDCLLAMASRADKSMALALGALVERDDGRVEEVFEDEGWLEACESEVDELAIRLLAMAPLARELRLITVAMKIAHNLKRVGDEAVAIARCASALNAEAPLKPYIDLPQMSSTSRAMLNEALGAFVEGGAVRARQLLPQADLVDDLSRQLHRELASYMIEQASNIPRCLHLMNVAKAFERVADHATNIAEEVVFLHEGVDIRHGASP